MTDPEPLSSTEARRIATTLLAHAANVGSGSPEYAGLATAALAYATLAPQLDPPQAEATTAAPPGWTLKEALTRCGLHVVAP